MFASLRRLIGLISVRESGDLITISGLPGDTVQKSIYDIWNTRKIADNVFTHISNSEVSFNKFFAVDVAYIFSRIIAEHKKGHNIRALRRAYDLMFENTWLKSTRQEHPNILNYTHLNELNVTMMDHQMEFFGIYNEVVPKYQLKGYLLGADPGTGKTLMCIGLSLCLGVNILICVCPKNAVERVWAATFEERFKRVPHYWHSLMDRAPTRQDKYLICHFDALPELLSHLRKIGVSGNVMIALDESHGLNEYDSLRSETFREICRYTRSNHVIWSSGTPIKAVGREATPLFSTIDPFFDEDAQRRFQAIYGKSSSAANDILHHRMGNVHFHVSKRSVVSNEVHTHKVAVKMDNGDDYTLEAIKEQMVKFVKERVAYYQRNMSSYEKQYKDILAYFERVALPKKGVTAQLVATVVGHKEDKWKEYELYKSYIAKIREGFDPKEMRDMSAFCNHYEKKVIMPVLPKEMRDKFKDIRSIIKYYMLKVQGEALGKVLGQARVKCHEDMLRGKWFEVKESKGGKDEYVPITIAEIIDQAEKKTIIFTSYVPVVDAANAELKKLGYRPILVYGATNNDLAAHVGTFEKNPDVNPLCATFASLSTAVPLVMANNTIMMNVPFRSYEYEQAVARTDRNGQDSPVHIWNVKLDTGDKPNISTRSHDIMAWSKQQVNEILGGGPVPNAAIENYPLTQSPLYPGPEFLPEWVFEEQCAALENFAEMEGMEADWSGKLEYDEPVKPSWANW
jgi:hypothetical protein